MILLLGRHCYNTREKLRTIADTQSPRTKACWQEARSPTVAGDAHKMCALPLSPYVFTANKGPERRQKTSASVFRSDAPKTDKSFTAPERGHKSFSIKQNRPSAGFERNQKPRPTTHKKRKQHTHTHQPTSPSAARKIHCLVYPSPSRSKSSTLSS